MSSPAPRAEHWGDGRCTDIKELSENGTERFQTVSKFIPTGSGSVTKTAL